MYRLTLPKVYTLFHCRSHLVLLAPCCSRVSLTTPHSWTAAPSTGIYSPDIFQMSDSWN